MELMTQADIARRLGISRQAVSRLIQRRDRNNFPEPVAQGAWRPEDIDQWQAARRRPELTRAPA